MNALSPLAIWEYGNKGAPQSYYFGSESNFAPVCVVPGLESSLLPLLRDCYVHLKVENPFGKKLLSLLISGCQYTCIQSLAWSPPFCHYLGNAIYIWKLKILLEAKLLSLPISGCQYICCPWPAEVLPSLPLLSIVTFIWKLKIQNCFHFRYQYTCCPWESSLLCPTTPVSLPPIHELQSHTLSMQYKIFTRRLVLFKVSHCCPCIWKKAILKVSFHHEDDLKSHVPRSISFRPVMLTVEPGWNQVNFIIDLIFWIQSWSNVAPIYVQIWRWWSHTKVYDTYFHSSKTTTVVKENHFSFCNRSTM